MQGRDVSVSLLQRIHMGWDGSFAEAQLKAKVQCPEHAWSEAVVLPRILDAVPPCSRCSDSAFLRRPALAHWKKQDPDLGPGKSLVLLDPH